MQVVFTCPRCLRGDEAEVHAETQELACRHCGWLKQLPEGQITLETPRICLVCGCEDLWRQKDFPASVGVALVGLGIVLSTLAVAWRYPLWGMGILMLFALADMLLFLIMPDRLVCYRCHAAYRWVGASEQHPRFDLEVHERYRQEKLRQQTPHNSSVPSSS
ncbi:MAG: hypothetical protein KatS3mg114_0338 [Planctomycetaceae bacterium]|nr:MAG: hypothetical protein KatS3mg114_0338 [Planctomycetaceae bacterium]